MTDRIKGKPMHISTWLSILFLGVSTVAAQEESNWETYGDYLPESSVGYMRINSASVYAALLKSDNNLAKTFSESFERYYGISPDKCDQTSIFWMEDYFCLHKVNQRIDESTFYNESPDFDFEWQEYGESRFWSFDDYLLVNKLESDLFFVGTLRRLRTTKSDKSEDSTRNDRYGLDQDADIYWFLASPATTELYAHQHEYLDSIWEGIGRESFRILLGECEQIMMSATVRKEFQIRVELLFNSNANASLFSEKVKSNLKSKAELGELNFKEGNRDTPFYYVRIDDRKVIVASEEDALCRMMMLHTANRFSDYCNKMFDNN